MTGSIPAIVGMLFLWEEVSPVGEGHSASL